MFLALLGKCWLRPTRLVPQLILQDMGFRFCVCSYLYAVGDNIYQGGPTQGTLTSQHLPCQNLPRLILERSLHFLSGKLGKLVAYIMVYTHSVNLSVLLHSSLNLMPHFYIDLHSRRS